MPVVRPTLVKSPRDVSESFRALQNHADQLEAHVETLKAQFSAQPPPLTLQQIRDGLSAAGSTPLNLTGLVGTPVVSPVVTSAHPSGVPSGSATPTPAPVPPVAQPRSFPVQQGTGRIRNAGKILVDTTNNNAIWPWRGATDFLLFKRYLDGDATVAAVITDRVNAGANLVRVFGMCQNITVFHPSTYPNYFAQLGTFADLLLAANLQLEFTVFADAQTVMPTTIDQLNHLALVAAALAPKSNVFIELANEYPANGVDPSLFGPPTGILSSAGSALGGDVPFLPAWDQVTQHTSRDDEWPRKAKDIQDIRDGNSGFTGLARPVIADEPMGAGDTDLPGSRSTVANDFYWYHATAQMMGVGSTFHSDNGIQSVVWDPTQRLCAVAAFAGMNAIPPASQLWAYTRGPLADCPIQHVDLPDPGGALRTFAKYTGNSAVALAIRPGPAWTAIAIPPWTIVSQSGPLNSLVFLTRP